MRYICSSHVRFLVERSSVRLLDIQRGHTLVVEYPEAAIWDFLSRGYECARIVKLLKNICLLTDTHAEFLVDDIIRKLVANGFVHEVVNNG